MPPICLPPRHSLPLTTLGFSICRWLCADARDLYFGEVVPAERWFTFAFIWGALIIFFFKACIATANNDARLMADQTVTYAIIFSAVFESDSFWPGLIELIV